MGTYGPGYQPLAYPVRPLRPKPLRHLPSTWTRPPASHLRLLRRRAEDAERPDRSQRFFEELRAAVLNGHSRGGLPQVRQFKDALRGKTCCSCFLFFQVSPSVTAAWERPLCVESRCDAVALGSNISVSAPFVRRCLTGSTMSPFSHPAHRTGQADFPHPALGQNFTPSPTARRAQACSGVRAQSARKDAEVDRSRPCDAWFCA